MPADAPTLMRSIDDLLRAEAQAIRRGDFAALGGLAERKGDLVGQLTGLRGRDVAPDLSRLRSRADANHRLLSAALQGVRAARARIDAIRRVETRLDTYDSTGRAQTVSFGASEVERRA